MPNCRNCSAPIPSGTLVCAYCGTRADIDLQGIHEYTVVTPATTRPCPRCNTALQTVDLKLGGPFLIERCEKCHGLFFDPGELQATLDRSVQHAYRVDFKAIQKLAEAKRHDEYGVSYVRCPECQQCMNRVNFGARSGVVVDECGEHGVWLDGGELRQLLEWTKAGGMLLHQQVAKERLAEQKERQERRQRIHLQRMARMRAESSGDVSSGAWRAPGRFSDRLLGSLARAAFESVFTGR